MKNRFSFYWRVFLQPHLFSFLGLLTLSFLVACAGVATVGLGVPLIDTAMEAGMKQNRIIVLTIQFLNGIGLGSSKNFLILSLLVLMSLAGILHSSGLFFQQYWAAWMAQKFRAKTKLKLFEKTLLAPYLYLAQKDRGALLYDINTPSQAIYQVMDLFGRMISPLMHIFLYAGLMLYLSIPVTLVVGGLGVLWIWKLRTVMGTLSAKYGSKVYELGRSMGKIDVDSIDGMNVVKSHCLESKMVKRQKEFLGAEWKPKLRLALLGRGVVLLNDGVAGFVVIILGFLVLGVPWIPLSFSELIVFMAVVRRLSPSFGTFSSMYVQFNQERKNMEVIDEILHRMPQEETGDPCCKTVKEIRLEKVKFSYLSNTEQLVLDTIDLVMKRGQMTGLVGPTGSGKSTLVKLLLKFYGPTSGVISINGTPLQTLGAQAWRQKVGYVSQDIFLFNETIRENIALWNTSYSREEIEKAAKLAQIHDFIENLPSGYDTIVGDRGVRLSGGQAQRVAIAREILKRPEVFIFDEATSALDNLTEKAVYEAVETLRQQAIVIVIAHRLSTVRQADQIVVLESGKIEARGRHETLLKEEGLYAELYNVHSYAE